MKEKHKVYNHTAKKISCCKCGTNLTKVFQATHNSNSMYRLSKDEYLCNATKCTTEHLRASYDRYQNESRNYTTSEEREIQFLKESKGKAGGWLLKEKYGIDL